MKSCLLAAQLASEVIMEVVLGKQLHSSIVQFINTVSKTIKCKAASPIVTEVELHSIVEEWPKSALAVLQLL